MCVSLRWHPHMGGPGIIQHMEQQISSFALKDIFVHKVRINQLRVPPEHIARRAPRVLFHAQPGTIVQPCHTNRKRARLEIIVRLGQPPRFHVPEIHIQVREHQYVHVYLLQMGRRQEQLRIVRLCVIQDIQHIMVDVTHS